MSDSTIDVDNCEILLRTNFSPIHFHQGNLLASAISSDDLRGRGFSVDREHLVNIATIEARIAEQMQRMPDKRQDAWIALAQCGAIRAEVYDSLPAFRVAAEPVDGNEAHAAIYAHRCNSPKSHIKGLKALLLRHLNARLQTFATYRVSRQV